MGVADTLLECYWVNDPPPPGGGGDDGGGSGGDDDGGSGTPTLTVGEVTQSTIYNDDKPKITDLQNFWIALATVRVQNIIHLQFM